MLSLEKATETSKSNSNAFSRLKLMMLTGCAFLLSQCATAPTSNHTPIIPVQQKLVDPYPEPAPVYLYLAKNKSKIEQQALLIKAAGRLIKEGRWQESQRILSQTNDLSPELVSEKSLLSAQIALMKNQPSTAIGILASMDNTKLLSLHEKIQYHQCISTAYEKTGSAISAISERVQLDNLLPDGPSKITNRNQLWSSLHLLSSQDLNLLTSDKTKSNIAREWAQLEQIARTTSGNAQKIGLAIEQWKKTYPEHPANKLLPSTLTAMFDAPKKIALLLPLTGPLAGPGNAVKDGFMQAKGEDVVKVSIYNTDQAQITKLYQQAINEGADYVVGPLSKTDAAAVAMLSHPVPTLLLNDADIHTSANTYQLAISPGYEAQQAAIKAHSQGYSRALVIAPAGDWGNEVLKSFEKEWQQRGGQVADSLRYGPNDDMNSLFKQFLHLSHSESRVKKMRELLGQSIEATPNRRQDFDVIFLLAYSSKARQIMPLLNYYYASDVPVYATSAVYAGEADAKRDADLNGMIFCDMSWVFAHQMGHKNWPEQFNSYNRLYAIGRDSYAFSKQLNQLILFSSISSADKSDELRLKSSHQIVRKLAWGQFKNGLAQKIT